MSIETEAALVGVVFLLAALLGYIALALVRRKDLAEATKDGFVVGLAGGIVVAAARFLVGV